MTILVNGGSGFISCNFGPDWLAQSAETIPRGDAPTQAGILYGHDEIGVLLTSGGICKERARR